MSTLFRRNQFIRTLHTSANGTSYEIGDVVIMENGNEMIREGAYEVFDNGIDLGIEVTRRLKADTGLKNKDKVFITKAENQSTWNDNTVYDMYIDNELLEFEEIENKLHNIHTTVGIETTYRSDKLDLGFRKFERHESETMDKLNETIEKWHEVEKGHISYLSTLDEVEKYTMGLLKAKKEIDRLIEKAKQEVKKELEVK